MKDNNNGNIPFYIALAIFFIIAILGITFMIQNSNSNEQRGTFGDMFGFANAVFTGFSVVGLLYTIFLQRIDINAQRDELKRQTEYITVQNFENSFFQLFSILNKVTEEVFAKQSNERLFGKIAMIVIHNDLRVEAQKLYAIKHNQVLDKTIIYFNFTDLEIREAIASCFDNKKNQLTHYFRTIFSLVELINSHSGINKEMYINILAAQFSRIEIMLLMYYVYYLEDAKYKAFIEKFSLLRDLDQLDILFPSVINYYENSAFNTDIV